LKQKLTTVSKLLLIFALNYIISYYIMLYYIMSYYIVILYYIIIIIVT